MIEIYFIICRLFGSGDDAIEYIDTACKMLSYFTYSGEGISFVCHFLLYII